MAPMQLVRLGRAVVRATYGDTTADCYVSSGTIERTCDVQAYRAGALVADGLQFASLRRFTEEVREVQQGYDCNLRVAGFAGLRVGDVIEATRMQSTAVMDLGHHGEQS